MPYVNRLNTAQSIATTDAQQLIAELDALRAEIDDIRSKYTALQAGITAGSAIGAANYPNATCQLAAARFTRT